MTFDHREYYKKNKKRLSILRKKRYDSDSEYREAIKKRSRKYWKDNHVPLAKTSFEIKRGDEVIQVHSISRVAEGIHRSIGTIRHYHSIGVIPLPSYSNSRGWRLYSTAQVDLLEKVFMKLDMSKLKSLSEVSDRLRKEW